MDWQDRRYCGRCSSELQAFSGKRSLADGLYYCDRCAQRIEQERLAKTTCAVCKTQLPRQQPKIVMPSAMCSTGPALMSERLLCMQCYRRVTYRKRTSARIGTGQRMRLRAPGRLMSRAYAVQ
ncbi:MAG: hypothetical protein KGH60_02905 [Candidatus Micrarchaeota archaeon]|nr:hypothetical protein [Candidatus Micrarchaeota archaeon]